MKNIFLGAAVFIAAVSACVGHITARTEMRATEEVCDLIHTNYYRTDQPDVREFLRRCESDNIPFTYTRPQAIKNINRRLGQIRSSHLSVYEPAETKQLWENEGLETGLRTRMIDGELVIIGTVPESPARRAELQAGDVIISINDQTPTSSDDARNTSGFFKIARDRKIFSTDLKVADVQEDLSPSLVKLNDDTAVLRLPSFLPQYFEVETWKPLSSQFLRYKHLIVDVRGNPGGSFPAMLRALSPFKCKVESVGELWRSPRLSRSENLALDDDLSAAHQLDLFERTDRLRLETFSGYGCFDRDAVVLIDGETSSVSEIFADAMKDRPRTKVWGALTAGQVVMARWFSIGSLGGGDFAISIPIAGFRDSAGHEIEQTGVKPQKEMYYDLESALHGEDSWIRDARVSWH